MFDIAQVVADSLQERERLLREEQAVRGLDALAETGLHPLISDALSGTGFGVLREQPYPHEWTRRAGTRPSPERRDRMRCDLVVTERPGLSLDDALDARNRFRKDRAAATGTLFESVAMPESPVRPLIVQPQDALWLEVKVIAQHTLTAGVLGANRTYGAELTRGPLADLGKLAADERITTGAALVVLFTESESTARHDIGELVRKSLGGTLPLLSPEVCGFPITDRLGNRWCAVALLGLQRV